MKISLLSVIGTMIITIVNINCKNNDVRSSKINGTIEKLSYSISKHGRVKKYTTIRVNKTEYEATIVPTSDNEFSFVDVARVGDTVYKASNDDTLYLTRAGFNGDVRFPFIVKTYNEN